MKLQNIIKLKAPKDITELQSRIAEFFSLYTAESLIKKPVSPRLFRIAIGVSKQTLSNWGQNKNKKELFDLIKTHEDLLLAFVENKTLDTDSKNVIGLINTLRAYDTERYVPEFRDNSKITNVEPIIIKAIDTSGKQMPKIVQAIVKES